jgi:multiple sugar transport system substrate-binding protein
MVFGDPAELAAYQMLVDSFEQQNPKINVELIHIPGQEEYRRRLGTDFAAGSPADVLLVNYRRYAAFAAKGALEPLGPYLAKSSLISEGKFYPQALAAFTWQEQLYCIPQNVSSLVVYYNKDLFDTAGVDYPAPDWTWDDFLLTAKALTRDTDGDGAIDQYGLGTEANIIRAAPFIWQNGGILVAGYPLRPERLLLDNFASREGLQWFVDLQLKHHVTPNAIEEASEDSEARFLNGRIAMYLNSRRGVPTYREIDTFDWDVAGLPRNRMSAGVLHSDAYCMPASVQDKDLAWKFIEYANSAEGQAIVARSGRTVPSLREVAESPAFLDPATRPANSRVFLDTLASLRTLPVMPTWPDIGTITSEEIERAFYGTASLDEAIQAAIQRSQIYFEGEE